METAEWYKIHTMRAVKKCKIDKFCASLAKFAAEFHGFYWQPMKIKISPVRDLSLIHI